MSSTIWENRNLEFVNDLRQKDASEQNGNHDHVQETGNRLQALKQLTLRLFREVQLISEVDRVSVETGVDYYDEVRRFEIDLIKRALMQTGGHQKRAARLLNLKASTLNSKIKLFNIDVEEFAVGYPLAGTTELDTHAHV
jgi:transcriptional regulator with GAF, ATPase, and Fis domain